MFGPNEYHKGAMASLVARVFDDANAGKPVRLFKSHRDGIADGDQRRDFIYVDDAVAVMRWLLESPRVSGIFNVGTGRGAQLPRSDRGDVHGARHTAEYRLCRYAGGDSRQLPVFHASRHDNLRRAGFNADFMPLDDGVARYVSQYLDRADRFR